MPSGPHILALGLGKAYPLPGRTLVALEDVFFEVQGSEFVAIIGPSGCGKSTLLKILTGVVPPTQGEVRLWGEKVVGPRRDIGTAYQSPVLPPWRTVLDNVLLPIEVLRWERRAYESKARALLTMVGLEGFERVYPRQLSGGMQQRVALCRALIHDPQLLLMDEPFGALDALTREQMSFDLLRIWSQTRQTVFFITHSIEEAVFLADRVLVMSARPGHIVREVPVALPRPRTVAVKGSPAFIAHVMDMKRLLGIGDSGPST